MPHATKAASLFASLSELIAQLVVVVTAQHSYFIKRHKRELAANHVNFLQEPESKSNITVLFCKHDLPLQAQHTCGKKKCSLVKTNHCIMLISARGLDL